MNISGYNSELSRQEGEVRSCLKHSAWKLKFSPALEESFRGDTLHEKKKRYLLMGGFALFFYVLFCFNDVVMLPDIYRTAWKIRLGIVTPLMTVALIMIGMKRFRRIMDPLVGLLFLLTCGSIVFFLLLSRNPLVAHYHTGLILIVMFVNIVARLSFWWALFLSAAVFCLYVSAIPHVPLMAEPVRVNSSMVLLSAIVISMVGNFQIEKKVRRSYLLSYLQRIDAVKLQAANRKLEEISFSDGLTGIANRRYFDDAIENECRVAVRHRYPVSLVFIDIDFFKRFNDYYGHQAGDECLKKVAEVIKEHAKRPHDVSARYGGEEFVVMLPHLAAEEAAEVAEKIREGVDLLGIRHEKNKGKTNVTVSLGVAGALPGNMDLTPGYLIRLADEAMYRAKKQGRNRVCIA